ncbi:MAG: nitroreductase family protein [Prolixibacteraceae bacterium]
MDFKNLVTHRFSVRKFKNRKIENEKLLQILEAGRMAPSAVNYQPWYFIVVQNPENLKKIHAVYQRDWIKTAPAVILICSDHSASWKRGKDGKDSADIDVAIAADHMTLQAADLGLGTCWVCNFDAEKCSELFDLPAETEPVVILPLGYQDMQAPEKKRKKLEEVVHWETFQ